MPSFIERLRKITGSGSGDKEAQSEQGDLVNPGMPEKKWQEVLAIAHSDPRKMTDLRQMLADYKARQAMAETSGGRKAYIKEAEKSAEGERLRQEKQKAIEKSQIQMANQKRMAELAERQAQLEDQRKADEIRRSIDEALAIEEARKQDAAQWQERRGL